MHTYPHLEAMHHERHLWISSFSVMRRLLLSIIQCRPPFFSLLCKQGIVSNTSTAVRLRQRVLRSSLKKCILYSAILNTISILNGGIVLLTRVPSLQDQCILCKWHSMVSPHMPISVSVSHYCCPAKKKISHVKRLFFSSSFTLH